MIKDIVQAEQISGVKFPKLHGHIKLTLTNAYSDNIEKVYEGDNLVTNAVKDIFANNVCGGIDYSKLYPLWQKWYGGILCYEQAHDLNNGSLDPNNYYPKSSSVNAVTAHAGQTTYTGADDMSRGSPLTDSQSLVFTEDSVKQTWEWCTNQGNGYIRALSLTHADTGDAGLGSTSSAFQAFNPYENIGMLTDLYSGFTNGIVAKYDDRHGLFYVIGEDGDYTITHYLFQTNKITVYIRPFVYKQMGLLDTNVPVNTFTRTFTVTTSINFYSMPAYYFDYANKKLWLFTNKTSASPNTDFSKTTVYYTVIDCVNETEDSYGTITSDASDLGMICVNGSYDSRPYPRVINIIKDGNYFCFPTGTENSSQAWTGCAYYTGLKKINFTNQSDQVSVLYNTTQTYVKPYSLGGGIIINGDRVINGTTGYTCSTGYFTDNGAQNPYVSFWGIHDPYAISGVVTANAPSRTSTQPRYILANKMVNTTLYNLDSVAQKLSSQRMTVEYSLTEDNS